MSNHLRLVPAPHCPRCGVKLAAEHGPWRPFCSERCQMLDLGDWASERFRVPAVGDTDERAVGEVTADDLRH